MKWAVKTFDHISSTQDLIKEKFLNFSREGLVIQAKSQEKGRGRTGRHWCSDEGNLYLSILLKPQIELKSISQIGFVMSLAVYETLIKLQIPKKYVLLKWPNDVLIDARKCGGILLETEQQNNEIWVFAGLGLNVKAAPDDASYLEQYTETLGINHVRDEFLEQLAIWLKHFESKGFAFIRQEWLLRAHDKGEKLSVHQGEERLSGVFDGLEEDGSLRLRLTKGEIKLISSGDVWLS